MLKRSKVQMLRAFLKQQLTVDAAEMSEVFDEVIAEYEEELCRLKEENERQQKLLEAVFNPELEFQTAGTTEHHRRSPSLDQDDPGPKHVREDQVELWTNDEDEGLMLKTLLRQRRLAVAERIHERFDRTLAEFKDDICGSTEENKRRKKLLEALFKPKVLLHRAACPMDVRQPSANSSGVDLGQREWNNAVVQENPKSLPIKEEQEEVTIKQEVPLTLVSVKTEEDGEKLPSPHAHQRLTEEGPDGSHLYREPHQTLDPYGGFQRDRGSGTDDSSDTQDSDEEESSFYRRTGGNPFRCAVCQKCFRHKCNMKRHMKTHTGEKPFACSICGAKFARKSHLDDHHTARHARVRPFACALCGKQFGCGNNFKKHMRRHAQEKGPPSCAGPGGRQMKHNCGECGKSFGSASILKRHRKVHTGEKPFTCAQCGQSFARNAHLANHMIRHTGEKPHSCAVCGKTFTRKDYIKVHMKIHARERKTQAF